MTLAAPLGVEVWKLGIGTTGTFGRAPLSLILFAPSFPSSSSLEFFLGVIMAPTLFILLNSWSALPRILLEPPLGDFSSAMSGYHRGLFLHFVREVPEVTPVFFTSHVLPDRGLLAPLLLDPLSGGVVSRRRRSRRWVVVHGESILQRQRRCGGSRVSLSSGGAIVIWGNGPFTVCLSNR